MLKGAAIPAFKKAYYKQYVTKIQKNIFRKKLSMPGLLQELKSFFQSITEPVIRKSTIPLVDCLLSGLAIFSLKYPSLLQFDKSRNDPAHNLKTLYGIKTIPSDTYLNA